MITPIAHRFFTLDMEHSAVEADLEDALLEAMGITSEELANCPFQGWCFDWYDDSFELRGVKLGWAPTEAQLAAAWELGFARCWICYTDGTERYASTTSSLGKLEQRGIRSSSGENLHVKRLEALLTRISGWDTLDSAADGTFWRREIAKLLHPEPH